MVEIWVKPCLQYGSCPFELDFHLEESNQICSVWGYECPSHVFAKKILGGEENRRSSSLVSEGDDLLIRMDDGVEEIEKCTRARELYRRAIREELEKGTIEYGVALYKQAMASLILANNGVDEKNNFLNAIELLRSARSEGLVDNTIRYAETLVDEAMANYLLVESGVDARANYEIAVELYQKARTHGFKKGTHEYASTMVDEADTLLQLFRLGVEPEKNLKKMQDLLSNARNNGLINNSFHRVVLTSLEEHLKTSMTAF